jgi:hypothetical protein
MLAQEYPPLIREARVNRNHMSKLRSNLSSDESFASTFIESGGIDALTTLTGNLARKKG